MTDTLMIRSGIANAIIRYFVTPELYDILKAYPSKSAGKEAFVDIDALGVDLSAEKYGEMNPTDQLFFDVVGSLSSSSNDGIAGHMDMGVGINLLPNEPFNLNDQSGLKIVEIGIMSLAISEYTKAKVAA